MDFTNREIRILLIISLLIGLFFCVFFPPDITGDGDQIQFNRIAQNLLKYKTFSLEKQSPFYPTIAREPFYPFFLFVIYKFFGELFLIVGIIQILIFSLTIIFTYILISKLINSKIAFYSSILVAICPPMANQTSYLLSESLFIFLIVIFVYLSTIMLLYKKNILFILNGFLLGLLTLCKASMLYFLPFLIICIIISKQEKGLAASMLLTISFLVIISPWLYRNYYLFETLKMTAPRGGKALYGRAIKLDFSLDDYKHAAVYYFSESLGKAVYPDAISKSKTFMDQFEAVVKGREDEKYWRDFMAKRDFSLMEDLISELKMNNLKRSGLNDVEIDNFLTSEALDKIKAHPIKYFIQMPLELIKMTAFVYLPLLNEEYIVLKIEGIKKGLTSIIRGVTRLFAYPILCLAFYGIYQYRNKWREFLPVIIIIVYFNLFYGLTFGYARYAAPLLPFYIMFATMGWFKFNTTQNLSLLKQMQ